jgi:hypothetical protein
MNARLPDDRICPYCHAPFRAKSPTAMMAWASKGAAGDPPAPGIVSILIYFRNSPK